MASYRSPSVTSALVSGSATLMLLAACSTSGGGAAANSAPDASPTVPVAGDTAARDAAVTLTPMGDAEVSKPSTAGTGASDVSSVDAAPTDASTRDAATGPVVDDGPCGRGPVTNSAASLYEPPDLPNVSLDGEGGALTVYSSTLRAGPNGLELYAGICHHGDALLCSVALQVEFYDQADQLIGTASGAVQSGRIYEFSQSPYPISCVAPGQTAMAALTSLPEGMTIADIKSIGHRFPAFFIEDAVPLAGVRVTAVEAVKTIAGSFFRGMVVNDSDEVMSDPVVSVFPLNEVGRPLGNVAGSVILEVPPGGTAEFETDVISDSGVELIAFATATFAMSP